ncbi:MAG: glucokinase [Pseudomonadota bacterium]
MQVLAGDIGGTNTRLCITETDGRHHQTYIECRYASGDHADLAAIVRRFMADVGSHIREMPGLACFAVAGAVEVTPAGETARITNLPWVVSSQVLSKEFGFRHVRVINDFQAVGYGIEGLGSGGLAALQEGTAVAGGPRAVLGAGTGLGQTVLVWQGDHYEALPTEGGHVSFAPTSPLQDELLTFLRARHGRVSCERLISGPGLVAIYEFLRSQGDVTESPAVAGSLRAGDPGAAISTAALEKNDALANAALNLFIEIYGAHAGDLALTIGASGGVYVAGGIAAKILPRLREGIFTRAFNDKGRMRRLTEAMPVSVVTADTVGLIGAALAAARMN